MIRVAIVDDHPVLREGTAAVLARRADLEVVALAGSLDEAAELFRRSEPPDVVLLDIRLGETSGLDLLASAGPETAGGRRPAVVIWTAYDYPQYVRAALRLGASGFVLKTAPTSELIDAICRAAAGGLAFGRRPAGDDPALTARERQVLALLVDGRSNDEIAGALRITARTVESHLARLFERFDTRSRTELATRALREGWLDVPAVR